MTDAILAILNTAIVQSVQPSGTTTGNASSTPSGIPPQLLPGGVIRGEVIGRDTSGNPILRTPQGTDVTIRTDAFLKYGNQVVIRVDQTGTSAKILSIDGQSPQTATPSIPHTPDSVVDEVSTNASQPRSSLASGQPSLSGVLQNTKEANPDGLFIKSVLLSKSPTAQATLSNLPPQVRIPAESLQPGSQVFVKLLTTPEQQSNLQNSPLIASAPPANEETTASPLQRLLSANNPAPQITAQKIPSTVSTQIPVNPATGAPGQTASQQIPQGTSGSTGQVLTQNTPTALAAATTANGTPGQPSPPPAQPSQSAAATANSNTAVDQRSAVRPPSQAALALQPALSQPTSAGSPGIPGTFMAFDASGDATFQTPLGILKMPQGIFGTLRLAPGSILHFDVTGFRVSGTADTASALSSSGYSNIAGMTGTLSDILTIMQSVSPQAAAELANRMPQTGANFTGSTLFFIAAMTGGDASKFLGQRAVNILEQQGRGDLVRKLGADFVAARSGIGETGQSQNWQLFYIPLMHDQEIHPVRMFVKRDKENEGKDKKKKGDTRFVIEVSLSALGEIQLDGFVKQKEKGIQFDLMLRTLQPLLPEDEKAIYEIYNNAAQVTGFTGSLSIQNLKSFPVKPMEEMLRSKEGSITA